VSRNRAFVYAVCGGASHIGTLQRSIGYLRARTALPIIVVTDTRRNEITIDHPNVIDIKTPDRLNHHQASIFLKTGLNRFLPGNTEYAYLDTDVIAAASGVDLIFDHRSGPVTFASDFTILETCVANFSPWAVNCSCRQKHIAACSHLSQAIERKFGISVPDEWVHWNGGVFLFGPDSVAFLDTWHTLTLQIFEDPYWKVKDQGTLVTTVWKYGLQSQPRLPGKYNFILDPANHNLHFRRAEGYSLHESLPGIHPTFLHVLRAGIDSPDWSLSRDVENIFEERSERAPVPPAPAGQMLMVVADRLASKPSPRTSISLKSTRSSFTARPTTDYRLIFAHPRWSLSGDSVLSAMLVQGLRKHGADARVLLTEENSDLAADRCSVLPHPAGVPFDLLPIAQDASWGTRWGALVRYLEDRAPCVYIPSADLRNSNVSPHLSEKVAIVGTVRSGDPRYYDQVERLGHFWNAIVSPSREISSHLEKLRPELASRMVRISPGVDLAGDPLSRIVPENPGPLRIVFHGYLAHHRKRVLELPSIIECLLARDVSVELTIIGDGPDRDRLITASRALIEKGALRWLGILPHEQVMGELQRHDVCLLTSGLEGLPLAVIEAMGSGCVPVVSDTADLSELVQDDVNGFRVPVGDLEGFCRTLEMLHREPGRRSRLSRAARQTIIERGFRSEDMLESWVALFERVMAECDRGTFRRPDGLLRPPPYQVAGEEVFPVRYFRGIDKVGVFPSYRKDYEDYRSGVGGPLAERLPAWREDLVRQYPVIIAASPMPGGKNISFAAALAKGLLGNDQSAEVLIRPGPSSDPIRFGETVRVHETPIEKAWWRPHYRALAEYLESRSPCLYLPADERLYWSVCPFLSNQIGVIGRVDASDPSTLTRAARMGTHWNAIVAGSLGTAERLIRLAPGLSSKVVTIPLPIDGPEQLAHRPFVWDAPLRVAHLKATQGSVFLNRIIAALAAHDLPIELTVVEEGSASVVFDSADVFIVLSETENARIRLLEAMGRGCVPVVARGTGTLAKFVKNGENGYVLPEGDERGFAARLGALQRNPVLRRSLSVRAWVSANALENPEVFVTSYSLLFERVLREIELGVHRR
jgi:glycosyltransferase involved in cell wall biosynthesis